MSNVPAELRYLAQPVPGVTPQRFAPGIVKPDESYVVFASGRPGGFGQGDLFVSFRQPDGAWANR